MDSLYFLVNALESRYVEKKDYLSRYTHERVLALREARPIQAVENGPDRAGSRKKTKEDLRRFIPFLSAECRVEFRGRILEIGAGGAWLSAELSKLPRVVEVVTTDLSPRLLKEEAPRTFKLLNAHTAKITRMPGDFHKLDFPDKYFDFVVCSAVLHDAANLLQVLREAKRVLKPGGRLVAIREPISPRVTFRSGKRKKSRPEKAIARGYTLSHYKEFFKHAGLPVQVKRVNLSTGFKYYLNKMVNGLTRARYAFIARRNSA